MMNVLIVGLGSIALKHIDALRKIVGKVNIYALRSGKGSREEKNVTNVYALSEISDIDFDFAIISNPTAHHADTIRTLLHLRIPLFIEKPLFADLKDEPLLKEIELSGVLTYVACNLRFYPCVKFLHDYIKEHPEERVNEVNVYCGSYLPEWRRDSDWRNCYSARRELGGGVHFDLIHELDYVYWIFGYPIESFRTIRNSSSLQITAPDYANYTLIYPGFAADITLNYYRRDYKRTIEIVFEDRTLLADLKRNTVTNLSTGKSLIENNETISDTYLRQMHYFLGLLAESRYRKVRAENDVNSAFEVLKICLNANATGGMQRNQSGM